jgi:hypothetical protein
MDYVTSSKVKTSVNMTSLESAYVNILSRDEDENLKVPHSLMEDAYQTPSKFRQLIAILLKRVCTFVRDWKTIFIAFSPFLITLMCVLYSYTVAEEEADANKELTPETILLQSQNEQYGKFFKSIIFAIWIIVAFSLSSGSYAENIVTDWESGLRTYFHTIGLKPLIYWVGNFISDFLLFAVSGGLFLLLVYPMGLEVIEERFWEIVGLTVTFGFALIGFTYLLG